MIFCLFVFFKSFFFFLLISNVRKENSKIKQKNTNLVVHLVKPKINKTFLTENQKHI